MSLMVYTVYLTKARIDFVEDQPLAQNKFDTRRPIQKLMGLPRPTNYFHSSRLKITSILNKSLRIGFI